MNISNDFSSLDLEALKEAEEWEEKMIRTGLYRDHFFDAFSIQIDRLFEEPASILEIGSGPGHLAQRIIETNKVKSYTLFDLSDSMNHIASKRLKEHESITDFKTGSFLDKKCFDELGIFDAVVCMQSVHEVRDKNLSTEIYKNVIKVIRPNGFFLVCDFVLGDPGMKDEAMYMTVLEQKEALSKSGFVSPTLISSHAGLTLYTARKHS
jgi:SAM-dependent methyltransferase